jgi:AraC-like DNA-binding protein
MRHGFRYSEDSNIISARFKCPDCPPDLTRSVISLGGAAAEAFFAALRVLLDNGGAALERPDEKMMFESLLSAAFQIYRATVLGREKKISPAVERAERVIAGAPGVRVTVAGAAKKAACSAGYLSSLFRKERGVSLKKYIAAKKMELAAKYLLYSDMTVTETAARLGFPDIYEFSRFVKRQTGKSPAQLRREEASRFAHSKKAE